MMTVPWVNYPFNINCANRQTTVKTAMGHEINSRVYDI